MVVPTDRLRGCKLIAAHLSNDLSTPYDPRYTNPYVLQAIGKTTVSNPSPFILEIGAKAGSLGRILSSQHKNLAYLGIDISPPVDIPCYNVLHMSIDEFLQAEYGRKLVRKADIVVCADVLEHLCDPWQTLRDISIELPMGAAMIASIPNFFHHSNFSSLGSLRFTYEAWGVMDLTHLRFFGLPDMLEMFQLCGFTPDMHSIDYALDQDGQNILERYKAEGPFGYTEGLLTLDISTLETAISLAAYQYIVTSRILFKG